MAAQAGEAPGSAPLLFFYTRLHDAIRAELGTLSQSVAKLESTAGSDQHDAIEGQLAHLRDRYRFLEQVYKYHSNVEDEVVYPALDSKVKNVTLAYSVEHEDEEHLLEELSALLTNSLSSATGLPISAAARGATIHQLARKVEQVHTTLHQHLAKEEEQLLPLLLRHFSFREQAALVAQFLCCIPLAAVDPVLTWLKRSVPLPEQAALLVQVQAAVPDRLLQQLITSWLEPAAPEVAVHSAEPRTPEATPEFVCCGRRGPCAGGAPPLAAVGGAACQVDLDLEDAGHSLGLKPPLREILYFHQAIRSALQSFAEEARALHAAHGALGPAQLTALVERHRFIRAVCLFHSASEDEIVFPALRRVALRQQSAGAGATSPASDAVAAEAAAAVAAALAVADAEAGARPAAAPGVDRHRCEDDHIAESAQFEELGRLLGEARACARRGSREVTALVESLSGVADRLARAMGRHMTREENDVLPVLMRSLCAAEQRHMVWRILCAMPLRLLERVMPWVAGKLREDDVREWLANIAQAAPAQEAPLVELLTQWAQRGAATPADDGPLCSQLGNAALRRASDDPAVYGNQTCGPSALQSSNNEATAAANAAAVAAAAATVGGDRPLKRIRTDAAAAERAVLADRVASGASTSGSALAAAEGNNPIDHIFLFHKALRRELKELELCAVDLQAAADDTPAWMQGDTLDSRIRDLRARFEFLRGIYRAHSHAEDEIVFPALEAKETLHNVSHAYTLDHQQEEALFQDVAAVVQRLSAFLSGGPGRDLPGLRALASRLARMCAAVRASLETHVRAEEKELWPLFAEHFSVEEQEHLVGVIIGRTGAEVLHTMLSWVRGSMTPQEQEAMMLSMKSASRSTAFEQWLGVALGAAEPEASPAGTAPDARHLPPGEGARAGVPSYQEEQQEVLAQVAQYLASRGLTNGGGADGDGAPPASDPTSIAADTSQFRPGWEDIFRMNQKQLEAAVRRVSSDPSLEPQRKAYLIQHLMASRYIVAQQRRMASRGGSAAATPTAAGGGEEDRAEGGGEEAAMPPPAAQPPKAPAAAAAAVGGGGGGAGDGALVAQGEAEAPSQAGASWRHYHDRAAGILGCPHYRRSAMLVAPCCDSQHVCRLCHDEAVNSHHQLDRYAVSEMVCMACGVRQAVGAACGACGASMARYYCAICHLFDDDPHRDIYHCPFCNFCRRGKGLGVDSFHCMSCNACMSLELFNRHRCTERALGGTCPVCSDPLFHSNSPIRELPCGHFMHSLCFGAYTRYSYTCPVCARSLGDMAVYWRMIDSLLEAERLPPEYASRRQVVSCNDCGIDTESPFHFVYHKCHKCNGYNTRIV